MKFRLLALALMLPLMGIGAIITVPTTGTVENFDSQTGCGYCFTAGPVVLPTGIIFTAGTAGTNSGLGAVLGTGSYGLGSNGSWSGPYFAGVDGVDNWMIFEFPSLVSAISALMNYCPDCGGPDPIIEVLDGMGGVLESYNLASVAPISTPAGFNAAEWRGIVRGTADIKALRVINSYIVVDDLTFGGVPDTGVPEPATGLLAAGALALVGVMARRRRA